MIILDTNIISEFMKGQPDKSVVSWLNNQDVAGLFLTTISIAEIGFGLRVMPEGRKQRLLSERFDKFVSIAFDQRVLSFDESAARIYGEIMDGRKEIGRPLSSLDGQIASIARSRGISVATRNTKDFEHCEIKLIDPFDFSASIDTVGN